MVLKFVLMIIPLPLFIELHSGSLALKKLFEFSAVLDWSQRATGIHVSLLLLPIIVIGLVLHTTKTKSLKSFPGTTWVLSLCFWYVIAWFSVGITNYQTSFPFFVQGIFPLIFFIYLVQFMANQQAADHLIRWFQLWMSISLLIVVIAAVIILIKEPIMQTANLLKILSVSIPKIKNYQPVIWLSLVVLLFSQQGQNRGRLLNSLFVVSLLLFIPLIWSRAIILMLIVFIGTYYLLLQLGGRARFSIPRIITLVVLIASFLAIYQFSASRSRQASGIDKIAVSQGDSRRLQYQLGAISEIFTKPVFGTGFTPIKSQLIANKIYDRTRMYPAHNQYLDIAIRSGLPGMIFFIFFLGSIALYFYRIYSRGADNSRWQVYSSVPLAYVASISVGNLFHQYFIQTQSALVILTMIALLISQSRINAKVGSS